MNRMQFTTFVVAEGLDNLQEFRHRPWATLRENVARVNGIRPGECDDSQRTSNTRIAGAKPINGP